MFRMFRIKVKTGLWDVRDVQDKSENRIMGCSGCSG